MAELILPEYVPAQTVYRRRYCWEKTQFFRGRKVVKWDGVQNENELNELLTGTIMVRRLKEDVLSQLPLKRRQQITLDSSRLDATIMSQFPSFLTGQQDIAIDIENPTKDMMDCFHRTAEAKIEAVGDYVEHLLRSGMKFLVFAHHYVMIDGLVERVAKAGIKFIKIDGRTSEVAKHSFVRTFQGDHDPRLAILGITSTGQGITLTAASTVVFAELMWLPGQMVQAEDRVHRIGQHSSVHVQYLIAEGTFDPILFKSLNKKQRNVTAMLDGQRRHMNAYSKSAAPTMSSDEICEGVQVELFGLTSDAALNGCLATVEAFCNVSGRWRVKLQSGDVKGVKAQNLRVKRLSPASRDDREQPLQEPSTPRRKRRTQWTDDETEKPCWGFRQCGKDWEALRQTTGLQHTAEEIETIFGDHFGTRWARWPFLGPDGPDGH
jgi:hypothetical protein